jgi:hypothetical protein
MPQAVQIGGPSGQMVGPDEFDRTIGYDDLPTGGSIIVFGPKRDLLKVAHAFMEFFVDESCGYCTPCRVGNVLLMQTLEDVIEGRGDARSRDDRGDRARRSRRPAAAVWDRLRPNPVLSTLKLPASSTRIASWTHRTGGPNFDLKAAVGEAERIPVVNPSSLRRGGKEMSDKTISFTDRRQDDRGQARADDHRGRRMPPASTSRASATSPASSRSAAAVSAR